MFREHLEVRHQTRRIGKKVGSLVSTLPPTRHVLHTPKTLEDQFVDVALMKAPHHCRVADFFFMVVISVENHHEIRILPFTSYEQSSGWLACFPNLTAPGPPRSAVHLQLHPICPYASLKAPRPLASCQKP